MKTTSLLIFLMLVLSCTNQETIEQNKTAQDVKVTNKRPTQSFNAQEVYFRSAIAEAYNLEQRQEEITEILEHEEGDENLEREFEDNNYRIEQLHTFSDVMVRVVGPIGPIPIPPRGCFDTARGLNCMPTENLANVDEMIVFNDDVEVSSIQIFDHHNELVGQGTEIYVNEYNQKVMRLEHNFEYNSIMISVLNVEGMGEITINTPVVIE